MTESTPFTDLGSPDFVCAVYDRKDRKVVHVHQFFGRSFTEDERVKMTLEAAQMFTSDLDASDLRVVHVPTED